MSWSMFFKARFGFAKKPLTMSQSFDEGLRACLLGIGSRRYEHNESADIA